jgi:hypothetical protein
MTSSPSWRNVTMANKDNAFQEAVEQFRQQHEEQAKKLMYVYFDDAGNIKCISPIEDSAHHDKFMSTKLPIVEVYKFITGELAPNKYKIEKREGKVNEYYVKKRNSEVSYVRTLDRFLTEVTEGYEQDHELEIIADEKNKAMTFRFTDRVRKDINESVDDASQATIHGLKMLKFYVTTKNDPSMLIESFHVPVSGLLGEKEVVMDYTVDIENYSIFTRRVLNRYGYKIIGE